MIDKPHSDGDLPLDLAQPTQRDLDRGLTLLRHALVEAPRAEGTLYGVDVSTLGDMDRALAFDFLWHQMDLQRRGLR